MSDWSQPRIALSAGWSPPERGDDVLLLAEHMLEQLGHRDAIPIADVADALLAYSWPGNVRELRNAIERAVHLGAAHAIPMADAPVPISERREETAPDLPFKQAKEQLVVAFEHAYVRRLMDRHQGNISAAARDAGIDRNYLYRLLKKHGLE
jgi:DNA-binding NtrC family response regulator